MEPSGIVTVAIVDTGVAYEDYTQTIGFITRRYYRAPDLARHSVVDCIEALRAIEGDARDAPVHRVLERAKSHVSFPLALA